MPTFASFAKRLPFARLGASSELVEEIGDRPMFPALLHPNQVFPQAVGRLKPRLRLVAFTARLEAAPFQSLLWFLEIADRHPSARFACSGQAKNRTRALPGCVPGFAWFRRQRLAHLGPDPR
jgi:hypothetical protein